MKTKLYLSVMVASFFLMIASSASGQGFGMGAKFGLNIATLSNYQKLLSDYDPDPDENFHRSPAVGMQAGFILNPMFSKSIGLEIELNFEQKGEVFKASGEDEDGDNVDYKSVIRYNFFTVPILLKAGYASKVFKIYGLFGPYVGVALGGKEKYYENKTLEETYTVEFGQGETSDNDNTTGGFKGYKARRLDVGLIVGLQPAVKLGPGDLFLDLRYNIGFLDIDNPTSAQKSDYNEQAEDYDMNAYYPRCQRAFGLAIGYIFRLGKK